VHSVEVGTSRNAFLDHRHIKKKNPLPLYSHQQRPASPMAVLAVSPSWFSPRMNWPDSARPRRKPRYVTLSKQSVPPVRFDVHVGHPVREGGPRRASAPDAAALGRRT